MPHEEFPSEDLYPIAVEDIVARAIQPQETEAMSVLEAGSSKLRVLQPNQVESIIRIPNHEKQESMTTEGIPFASRQPQPGPEPPAGEGSHEAKTACVRSETSSAAVMNPVHWITHDEVTQTVVDMLHEACLSIHSLAKRG